MAPARRKAGRKNSAVPASRRQWKVGDLVLAKVKGFPAWPATVSEPQKWGYSTDWKKVLVHFFGTKQIAFCNPADVEAFTEEKKNTLLSKRQGKGSDFVRAVNEIVDSYEKLMKQGGSDQLCDEVATLNHEISENLPRSTFSSLPKTCVSLDHSDSCSADEIPLVSGALELHNTEVVSKVAFENALGLDQLSQTHLSIKKRSQVGNGASQKVGISVRKSRSSSRIDSYNHYQVSENKLETDGFSYNNGRKENIVGESLHTSECPDLDLLAQSAIVSSNASDARVVLKVGKDTVVGNAHTCVKSSSSYEDVPHVCGGCVENDALSSGSDESEASAVSIKRIREQVRCQNTDDAAETSFLDEERCSQNERNKQNSCFSNVCENCHGKMYGVDGDEHLPLVKRARVRMGKAALNKMCEEVEKKSLSENLANDIETTYLSSSCHTFDSQRSCVGYFARMDSSPCKTPTQIAGNSTDRLNAKNLSNGDHIFNSETALPPSKRLHRALEAMNANVAEGDVEAENTKPSFHECTTTTSGKLSFLGVQDALLSNGEKPCYDTFFVLGNESQTTPKILKNTNQYESAISIDNLKLIAPNHKLVCNLSEVKNPEDLPMDSHNDHESMLVMKSTTDSYQLHEKLINMETDKNFSEVDENVLDSSSNPNLVVPTVQGDSSRERMLDLHLLSGESAVCDLESVSVDDRGENMCSGTEKKLKVEKGYLLFGCASEGVKSLQSKFNAKLKLDMHELKKNVRAALSPKCIEISPCTNNMEDVNKVEQFNSPTSASKSRDCKVVTEAMFSQHQFNGIPFSEQVSSCLSNNGTRSDIIDRDQNRSHLSKDKLNSSELLLPNNHNSSETLRFQGEADPMWRSFKAAVRSVSRTKESIARATRLALDCAKHGMCHEVIKLLLRNLESESNLHRRIDLFFLVDSITQCARGQKGVKGDNYFSAVEVALPRLLSAAAPPGNEARENRKQCLKVLRLWLERKILPESIVRQQLQELEFCDETPYSYSAHPARTERGINDPLVEVGGMLVDEYGSNTSMQLSGFTMPQMLEDEEETFHNDVQIFEAVTPERDPGIPDSGWEEGPVVAVERHPHILEEVDGELEMEDVAPSCDSDVNAGSSVPFVPPLPEELPPSPPPLPVSPPPAAPSIHPSLLTQQPVIRLPSVFPQGVGEHWPRQPNSSCVKLVFPESFPCHAPRLGDNSMRASTIPPFRSYGISQGSHSSIHPSNNNIRRFDTGVLPHKPYHIRLPPTVSSQLSYVQADSHRRSQPRNYSSNLDHQRSNFEPEIHGSNQVACRNRMNLVERTTNERCRYSSPANLGQRHDKSEGFHHPIPYRPLSAEGPISDHGWHIAHRRPHQRHHSAVSPPFQSSTRAPQFWRPR